MCTTKELGRPIYSNTIMHKQPNIWIQVKNCNMLQEWELRFTGKEEKRDNWESTEWVLGSYVTTRTIVFTKTSSLNVLA